MNGSRGAKAKRGAMAARLERLAAGFTHSRPAQKIGFFHGLGRLRAFSVSDSGHPPTGHQFTPGETSTWMCLPSGGFRPLGHGAVVI